MNTLTEFLFAAPARRTTPAIIAWWEKRRLGYNLWVGAAGTISLVSVAITNVLMGGALHIREALFAAAIFGFMANICYFFGPATELFLEKVWGRRALPAGPTLFRMGLTFSVGLALFPTLLMVILLTVRTIFAVLGIAWK